MTSPEPYDLTPAQAGELIGVSGNTVKRWAEEGHLGGIKLPNGYFRFRRTDVLEFIESRRTAPETAEVAS